MEARGHVLPEVAQRGRQLLLGAHHHERAVRHELEQLAEAVHREHVGHVGALLGLAAGGDLGQLPVLGAQLGRGGDLHPLGLLERALGEGGEPGEALDLDVEQLAAHRALLGGGVHVEDVAPDGELAAILDLVGALVAAGHEPRGHLVEVEQAALLDLEAVRAQLGVGHLLRQRGGARHHHGGLAAQQRVERRDAQAHEVRRRRQVRLVAHPARRVEAHPARGEVGPQVGGQVARRAVVARHHQRGPLGLAVEQAGEQVGPQAGRHEGALGLAPRGLGQRADRLVLVGVSQECSEHAQRPPGRAARLVVGQHPASRVRSLRFPSVRGASLRAALAQNAGWVYKPARPCHGWHGSLSPPYSRWPPSLRRPPPRAPPAAATRAPATCASCCSRRPAAAAPTWRCRSARTAIARTSAASAIPTARSTTWTTTASPR